MSKLLAELLGVSEPKLNLTIRRLEAESGHPNIDVHLIGDLSSNIRRKLRELGLDPQDTNGPELYHALQKLVQQHDLFLSKVMGATDSTDVKNILPLIKTKVQQLDIPHNCWALKYSVAKKLLKAMPPKRVMKHLNYKSIDSMLKRERITGLFAATRIAESKAWQEKFIREYKQLKPGDFENRQIDVMLIRNPRWQTMAEDYVRINRHNIASLKEMGAIILLPMPVDNLAGVTMAVLPMLLRSINELRSFSAYLKLEQVKPNFGSIVAKTLLGVSGTSLDVAGQRFPWRVIQQYVDSLDAKDQPEIFGPHLQPEDLQWTNPEDVLYRLEPALKFWEGFNYTAAWHDGRPISFSLLDNAINSCNQLSYGNQFVKHFRENLKTELYRRYLAQTPLGEQTLNRLDDTLVGVRGELERAGV